MRGMSARPQSGIMPKRPATRGFSADSRKQGLVGNCARILPPGLGEPPPVPRRSGRKHAPQASCYVKAATGCLRLKQDQRRIEAVQDLHR